MTKPTTPAVLDCPAEHGGGTLRYHVGGRVVTIEVGRNEPAACVTARLVEAINAAIAEAAVVSQNGTTP